MQADAPLFERHVSNPILTAADWSYPVHTVFNPGAVRLRDGTTLLLCRVEDHRGLSHLCAARSANGVDGWNIDAEPTLMPDPERYPEELWGIEDPRITFIEELGKYAVTYTASSPKGPSASLAFTEDFRTFERCGPILCSENKHAVLLSRRVGGGFALLHRPMANAEKQVWVSFSSTLRAWGNPKPVLQAREGWWDAVKVGLSPPLIETLYGWLMFYHGVRETPSGLLYRIGAALLALDQPERCLARGDAWVFGPKVAYERAGNAGNVVYSCGATLGDDGDTINLYYGAADTCIALAIGSVREVLHWLTARA